MMVPAARRVALATLLTAAATLPAVACASGATLRSAAPSSASSPPLPPYAAAGAVAAVAADVPACSAAGLTVLREWGGAAADAAVLTTLCQGVYAPYASGLGGGGFILATTPGRAAADCTAARPEVDYWDAREVAPAGATAARYANVTRLQVFSGGLGVGVPGELAGLAALHAARGRLPWARLVRAAAAMADATPVSSQLEVRLAAANASGRLGAFPALWATYTVDDAAAVGGRRLVRVGDTLRRPALAATLRSIAADGPAAVYGDTPIGRSIADAVVAAGGTLTTADLRAYAVVRRSPIAATFVPPRGAPWAGTRLTLLGAPPPSSGGAVLGFLLRLLAATPPLPAAATRGAAARRTAALVEAFQHAFARRTAVGDPAFEPTVTADVRRLFLSRAAVAAVRPQLWSPRARPADAYRPPPAQDEADGPPPEDRGTTHVSVVDADGAAVAITSSVNFGWGSGVVAPAAGVVLNNQLADFGLATDARPVGVNGFAPGARPLSSMSPSVVLGPTGAVVATAGGSGGPRILTAVAQVLLRALAGGEAVAAAVAAPRLHHPWLPAAASLEGTAAQPPDACALVAVPVAAAVPPPPWARVCADLRRRGHALAPPRASQVQAIVVGRGGGITAASDPRKEGAAAAY